MDRRQPQDIHVPLYNNGIGPGAARVVHYRVKVPKDAKGAIALSAGVHYRKFSRDYTTFSLGAASPSLPVTTLASDTVTLPIALPRRDRASETPRQSLQARQRGPALAALERLRHRPLPAGRPEGRRRRVDEGRGAGAGQAGRAAQPRAGRDRRGAPRRRQGVARRGRAAPARLGQDRVLPRDRRQGRGAARRRGARPAGRPREVPARPRRLEQPRARLLARRPLPRRRRGLRQDARRSTPEDLTAHYNLMRVYRAMGDRRRGPRTRSAYRKYKDDESIRAVAGDLAAGEPVGQPRIAADPRPRRGRAAAAPCPRPGSPPSGRRATRRTAATSRRPHPPIPREATQWSYADAPRPAAGGRRASPSAP